MRVDPVLSPSIASPSTSFVALNATAPTLVPRGGLPGQTEALADLAYDVVGTIFERLAHRASHGPSPVGATIDLTV